MKGKGEKTVEGVLPPYAGYSSWQRLIEHLREFFPSRIDASYLDDLHLSGSTRSMLKGTLLFLELMDPVGSPTEKLRHLAESEGNQRVEVLRDIVQQGYSSLFAKLDVGHATQGQLREYFTSRGASGDIGRKCTTFFLAIANEAGINLSPSLRKTGLRQKAKKGISEKVVRQTSVVVAQQPANSSWEQLLLAKFPDFSLDWPDNVKAKWLQDFGELAKMLIPRKPAE